MFFELNDGTIINKHWLNNVFIDENDNTKVVYEMVNGSRHFEQYNTEQQAQNRLEEVKIILENTVV